jgi:hypothetical protein
MPTDYASKTISMAEKLNPGQFGNDFTPFTDRRENAETFALQMQTANGFMNNVRQSQQMKLAERDFALRSMAQQVQFQQAAREQEMYGSQLEDQNALNAFQAEAAKLDPNSENYHQEITAAAAKYPVKTAQGRQAQWMLQNGLIDNATQAKLGKERVSAARTQTQIATNQARLTQGVLDKAVKAGIDPTEFLVVGNDGKPVLDPYTQQPAYNLSGLQQKMASVEASKKSETAATPPGMRVKGIKVKADGTRETEFEADTPTIKNLSDRSRISANNFERAISDLDTLLANPKTSETERARLSAERASRVRDLKSVYDAEGVAFTPPEPPSAPNPVEQDALTAVEETILSMDQTGTDRKGTIFGGRKGDQIKELLPEDLKVQFDTDDNAKRRQAVIKFKARLQAPAKDKQILELYLKTPNDPKAAAAREYLTRQGLL